MNGNSDNRKWSRINFQSQPQYLISDGQRVCLRTVSRVGDKNNGARYVCVLFDKQNDEARDTDKPPRQKNPLLRYISVGILQVHALRLLHQCTSVTTINTH